MKSLTVGWSMSGGTHILLVLGAVMAAAWLDGVELGSDDRVA
jgi:hypothetical protein